MCFLCSFEFGEFESYILAEKTTKKLMQVKGVKCNAYKKKGILTKKVRILRM